MENDFSVFRWIIFFRFIFFSFTELVALAFSDFPFSEFFFDIQINFYSAII